MKKKTKVVINLPPKLPEDKDSVQYFYGDNYCDIESRIEYDCGCVWVIVWDDIEYGHTVEMHNDYLCVEHDPTISDGYEEDE